MVSPGWAAWRALRRASSSSASWRTRALRGSGGSGNQNVSLGTYVAPKLFMEYESSLGDEQDKIKLRYDFNNWVEFQTETGEGQGADVFLKLER